MISSSDVANNFNKTFYSLWKNKVAHQQRESLVLIRVRNLVKFVKELERRIKLGVSGKCLWTEVFQATY